MAPARNARTPNVHTDSKPDGPRLPSAPRSIETGSTLKTLLGYEAIDCLGENIARVHRQFSTADFVHDARTGLDPLGIMDRGKHLARTLRKHLPTRYATAVGILVDSLGPPHSRTDDLGLAPFFYLPHVQFVALFGADPEGNGGQDPFEPSMGAQYEITRRFSAEFSIRTFLLRWPERTLNRLLEWTADADPHVRRLCSEGSRPRLPWAARLPDFIEDPRPVLPILQRLRDDDDLYVRRSVANHLGDIAKDHPGLVFDLCERWLVDSTSERRWLIRHALRHPAKKGNPVALRLRRAAA